MWRAAGVDELSPKLLPPPSASLGEGWARDRGRGGADSGREEYALERGRENGDAFGRTEAKGATRRRSRSRSRYTTDRMHGRACCWACCMCGKSPNTNTEDDVRNTEDEMSHTPPQLPCACAHAPLLSNACIKQVARALVCSL